MKIKQTTHCNSLRMNVEGKMLDRKRNAKDHRITGNKKYLLKIYTYKEKVYILRITSSMWCLVSYTNCNSRAAFVAPFILHSIVGLLLEFGENTLPRAPDLHFWYSEFISKPNFILLVCVCVCVCVSLRDGEYACAEHGSLSHSSTCESTVHIFRTINLLLLKLSVCLM
jgi:hypothetical protein